VCDSLSSRVVELVLAGASEAGLHAAVPPQSLHHPRQLRRHEALLRRAGQHKELPGIVLVDGGGRKRREETGREGRRREVRERRRPEGKRETKEVKEVKRGERKEGKERKIGRKETGRKGKKEKRRQ